jgi:hypothetical protein
MLRLAVVTKGNELLSRESDEVVENGMLILISIR